MRRAVLLVAAAACMAAGAAPEKGAAFKDWVIGCRDADEASPERCFIVQNIALKESGQRLLHIAIGTDVANGKPAAIVTLPLGILLPAGIALSVDEGEPVRFPVQRCTSAGCTGVLPLSVDLLGKLRAGRQARVAFADQTGREIAVPVSLLGFTAGYKALGG